MYNIQHENNVSMFEWIYRWSSVVPGGHSSDFSGTWTTKTEVAIPEPGAKTTINLDPVCGNEMPVFEATFYVLRSQLQECIAFLI